jgi:hypothetical protein
MQCKVTDMLFSIFSWNFATCFDMVADNGPRLGAWLVKLRPSVRAWFTSSDARVLRRVDVRSHLCNSVFFDSVYHSHSVET